MKFSVVLILLFLSFFYKVNAAIEEYEELVYGTISVSAYGAIPDDGLDDTQAIRNAINAAIASNTPQIVLFEAGRYDLKVAGNNNFYIRLVNANNVILRGVSINNQPATRLVRFNSGEENASLPFLLQIRFSKNIAVENLVFDNDPYYYTAGVVTAKSGNTITVDVLPGHPMNILKPYIMGGYDMATGVNKTLRITWDNSLPTWNPIAGGSGRLLRMNFEPLASAVNVGDGVFWFQGNHGGTQVVTGKSENITFKNLVTHNSTGFVYHFVDNNNVTLNKVKIEPTGNRIAVSPRDGIHFAHCRGLISLDGVVIKNTPGDDGLNVHGMYISVGAISSKTITFKENLVADLKPGSRIQFLNADFRPVWTGTIESATPEIASNNPVTVVLKETPPGWIAPGTIASPLGWLPKSFIVKNSTFENTGRFGITAKTTNVVVDSSTFRFNSNAGVALGSSFNAFFKEAQPAWNVVVKNTTFENNITRMGDQGPGGVFIDQISVDNPNVNGNMYLFKNTFNTEQHAYNIRDATNVRLWGNVYNNVTTPIWRHLPTTSNFSQGTVFNDYVTDDLHVGAILYNESWPVSSNAQDSLGSVSWNDKPGSFAEFHFVGNHISYYARRAPIMGKVDVYLDDQLVLPDFDLYSNNPIRKSLIYSNDNLVNSTHTLRIENTGRKNVNATGNFVNIDFLVHKLGDYIVTDAQPGDVLPVHLISFDAKAIQDKVRLFWQTTNEMNNSYFEVIRLDANSANKSIGRVNAKKDNGAGINHYFLYDYAPNKGTNYYQLKQYDIDGTFSSSKIVAVKFGLKSTFSVYPNPVRVGETVRVRLENAEGKVDIQLLDINQRVVAQKSFDGFQNNIEWPTSGLRTGVYMLRLMTNNGQFAGKIIVTP